MKEYYGCFECIHHNVCILFRGYKEAMENSNAYDKPQNLAKICKEFKTESTNLSEVNDEEM